MMLRPRPAAGSPVPAPASLAWLFAVIGTLALAPQPARGQTPAVGSLGADDHEFRRPLQDLLLEAKTQDLAAGWRLCAELGPAAAPLLWAMHDGEKSNARRRIVLIFAAMVAGGPLEDERAFAALERAKQPQDRLMTCLAFALGPPRAREQPSFWTVLGRKAEQNDILTVASLLACARFPGAAALAPEIRSADPGVVAAAAFAGAALPAAVVERFFRDDAPVHAGLVWRGVLLGSLLRADAAQARDPALLQRARWVWETRPERVGRGAAEFLDEARGAAALVLGRAAAMTAAGPRPPGHLLQLLAAEPQSAIQLRDWLKPEPQIDDDEPARLAVAYAFSREPAAVVAERDAWSRSEPVRRPIAVALAWRLLGAPPQAPIEVQVTGLPEWFFVRWASGAAGGSEGRIDDPILGKTAALAQDGSMPREAARDILEQALWRWRCHPGIGIWEAERRLVRDLLLTGSQEGRKYKPRAPDAERYRPTGLGTEDPFFEVGVKALDFDLSAPRLPIPKPCRLR
jgi:hypothetical protein